MKLKKNKKIKSFIKKKRNRKSEGENFRFEFYTTESYQVTKLKLNLFHKLVFQPIKIS